MVRDTIKYIKCYSMPFWTLQLTAKFSGYLTPSPLECGRTLWMAPTIKKSNNISDVTELSKYYYYYY